MLKIISCSKIKYLKFRTVIILLLATAFNQSCAPFSTLCKTVDESSKIEGLYYNDCHTDTIYPRRLWALIDYKHEVKEDSLLVKMEIISDIMLKAQLIRKDDILVEKIFKGEFKEDNCFYTRRRFWILPILPIIWAFSNEQERFYRIEDDLILERTSNSGGVMIFMAGGNSYNDVWEYKKSDISNENEKAFNNK